MLTEKIRNNGAGEEIRTLDPNLGKMIFAVSVCFPELSQVTQLIEKYDILFPHLSLSELFISAAVLTMCLLAADSHKEINREYHQTKCRVKSAVKQSDLPLGQ